MLWSQLKFCEKCYGHNLKHAQNIVVTNSNFSRPISGTEVRSILCN